MAVADQAVEDHISNVPSEIHRFPSGCSAGRTLSGVRVSSNTVSAVRPAGVCLRDTAQNCQPTLVPTPMTLRVRSRSRAR